MVRQHFRFAVAVFGMRFSDFTTLYGVRYESNTCFGIAVFRPREVSSAVAACRVVRRTGREDHWRTVAVRMVRVATVRGTATFHLNTRVSDYAGK